MLKKAKALFYKQDECETFYKMGKILGQGSFATVKLATNKKDGTKWAIKVIQKKNLGPEDDAALKSEVEVLQSVKHENIVFLNEIFDTKQNLYMVMEVCAGGELFDRITEKDHYSENEARFALRQIAMALEYCHERNIVHRDLKPENLLYGDDTEEATLKLADFGLAKLLDNETMLHAQCGTPGYVAPEIVNNDLYGVKVDMWSLGVIAYILFCGFPPFYDDNNQALFRSIKKGQYEYPSPFWDEVSDTAKDLIDKLLVLNPEKRYSAKEVLAHPFMTNTAASTRNLSHFKKCMVSYNARRKFRAGIMSLQAISAMKGFTAGKKEGAGGGGAKLMAALAGGAMKEKDTATVAPVLDSAGGEGGGETVVEEGEGEGEVPPTEGGEQ
ncbi:hypothetical protein TrVE_jg11965 [Triparma verrucosa]|uniref:Protein kinase domain-containing protein n=1 Tax=Triparma verrucosa TaxID=1606542 RepID=A0A9W7C5W6_9STRA|nr:hypothetical protein TrVE_jg11965 [Triparma verrucosa]